MSKLIIHIGPPKCGSSSIQSFLQHKPCKGKTKYIYVPARQVDIFNKEEYQRKKSTHHFINSLNKNLKVYDNVILSQEYFFGNTKCIENICKEANADEIIIAGYSRKQSGFLISAYSQWEFRSKKSHQYSLNILKENNIDTVYLTGLESFLAAIILSDFKYNLDDPRYSLYDWEFHYQLIEDKIPSSKLIVNCLPSKTYPYKLIQDFCVKTGLSIKSKKLKLSNVKDNTQFDSILTESIYNAVEMNLEVPPVHSENNLLKEVSSQLGENKVNKNDFITNLSNYIDTQFYESNIRFCNKYSIPIKEFEPLNKITKNEIVKIIHNEINYRKKKSEFSNSKI